MKQVCTIKISLFFWCSIFGTFGFGDHVVFWFADLVAVDEAVLLEVFGLLEDFFEDFVFGEGRVFVLGQGDDDVHLQLRLAVGAGGPVDVAGFVVNDEFDFLG